MIILIIVYIIFCFLIAEVFGRRKQIGFWWSLLMLLGGFINGIIAIILSPSAKKNKTVGKKLHNYLAITFLYFFGLIPLIFTIFEFLNNNFIEIPILFLTRFGISILFVISGLYLCQLSKGNIYNENPKFYLENIINLYNNNYKYYIIENGLQSESYTYLELKNKNINEDTLIWRKGLENWTLAKDLIELESIIEFLPPPIHFNNNTNKITELSNNKEVEIEYANEFEKTDKLVEIEKNKNEVILYKVKVYSYLIILIIVIILIINNL
jgi:hypothetical protein